MNYYNVGKIVNTQGLQGEMRVLSVTDFAEERFKKGSKLAVFDDKDNFLIDVEIASHRKQKNFDIIKFKGMYHINDIEKYKGCTLKVAEENLSELEDGEFYYHEIIGLDVYENDVLVGQVKEILQPGANDVWVVKRKGKRDLLLPYIPPVVLNVDVAANRVDVDILEGIDILTLFPEMFAPLEYSIVGKAKEKGLLDINYHNFRDNAEKSRHVDDEPYGGGQGMLLRAQPIFDTIDKIDAKKPRVILLDPAGRTFDQSYAEELAQEDELIFICGHYEGYDERIKTLVTDEISLGDFVLTGGELAAMTIVDATVRLIPNVLGKEASHQDDSFSSGLLEFPQYTRPYDFRGMKVPDVLMSGHHENIRKWRIEQSLRKTLERRPDLLEDYAFTKEEEAIFRKILKERDAQE